MLDTNVVVAASFRTSSDSAWLLQAVREGAVRVVWNDETRAETEHIVRKIPVLSWSSVEGLYRVESLYRGETDAGAFELIQDPDDRKFASLAAATGATLVTLDDHLLGVRARLGVPILRPGEFLALLP